VLGAIAASNALPLFWHGDFPYAMLRAWSSSESVRCDSRSGNDEVELVELQP